MDIQLEALGNLGDFIGGIAVVVTLLYLAVQIRHNTAALQTASRQEIASGYREANRVWFDPANAAAFAEGLDAYPNQTFDRRNRFGTVMNDQALFFQGVFALHESGQLEAETYRAYMDWFSSIVASPGGLHWWETVGRPIYVKHMVSAVDARLAKGGLHDVRELRQFQLDEPLAD
jgi:hypothetical protein